MKHSRLVPSLVLLVVSLLPGLWSYLDAQFVARDPGPRGAPVDAGKPIAGLTDSQTGYFEDGMLRFGEIASVSGNLLGEVGVGLGPGFNGNSCGSCHSQPAVGGTSPNRNAYPNIGPNPQVAVATLDGATNTVPFFITADGPVREAHLKYFLASNGSLSSERDGGVHNVFTIKGRDDATNIAGITGSLQSCEMAQPDFQQMQTLNNLSLRIPTPLFGAGFIENIPKPRWSPTCSPMLRRRSRSASAGISIAIPTTAPLRASAGRRRTSRCNCFPPKPRAWKWASATRCSPTNAAILRYSRRPIACSMRRPRTTPKWRPVTKGRQW